MNAPTLSICVPVFNEAENIPLLYEAVIGAIDPPEFPLR
jgi:glycosyltransferase involved in cell wall biosynthesis